MLAADCQVRPPSPTLELKAEAQSFFSARTKRWARIKQTVVLFVCAYVLSLVSACSNERTLRWQEEVELASGERLVLSRTRHYRRSSEPGNPLRSGWAPENSSIEVKEGPTDLVGAKYRLKDWIEPVVIDRDSTTRALVMVGNAWNCDWVKRFGDKPRGIYIAFELKPGQEATAIDFPSWAWSRRRNLYMPYFEIDPPPLVTPAEAERHNKISARGSRDLFLIDPNYKSQQCGGGPK